jgi:hypothetical protein
LPKLSRSGSKRTLNTRPSNTKRERLYSFGNSRRLPRLCSLKSVRTSVFKLRRRGRLRLLQRQQKERRKGLLVSLKSNSKMISELPKKAKSKASRLIELLRLLVVDEEPVVVEEAVSALTRRGRPIRLPKKLQL